MNFGWLLASLAILHLALAAVQDLLPPELRSQVASIIEDEEFGHYVHNPHKFTYIELKNGARALVVSNKKAVQGRLVFSFDVGYANDPDDTLGISDLLTRCALFDAEGKKGWDGANFTSLPHMFSSGFLLETSPSGLQGSVKQMVNMLLHPKYTAQLVDSKRKEGEGAKYSYMRLPFFPALSAHFGNPLRLREWKYSLSDLPDLHQRLREFQARYYTSDHAAMLLEGHEPVEELAALAVKELSKFKKGAVEDAVDLYAKASSENWIAKEKLGKQVYYVSQSISSSVRSVDLLFPLSNVDRQHELAAQLVAEVLRSVENWAGFDILHRGGNTFARFHIIVTLDAKMIGNIVFSVIHFLRQQEPPMWWVEDRAKAFEMHRQSSGGRRSYNPFALFAKGAKIRDLPFGLAKDVPFTPEEWRAFLNNFNVDNVLLVQGGGEFRGKCDKEVDGHVKGYWGVEELNPEWKKSWQRHLDGEEKIPGYDLVMPPRNNFISASSEVKALDPSSASDVPIKVPVADPAMSDKLDLYWWQPQDRDSVQVALRIRISLPSDGYNMDGFSELIDFTDYCRHFPGNDWLGETAFQIGAEADGTVDISVHAPADVMPKFLRTALLFMSAPRTTNKNAKKSVMERFHVEVLPAPKLREYFQGLVDGTVTPPPLSKAFSRAHIQIIAGGNLLKAEAQQFASDVVKILGVKEGMPATPFPEKTESRLKDLYDEKGRPRRIRTRDVLPDFERHEKATVTIVWREMSNELEGVGALVNRYMGRTGMFTCSNREGCKEASITYERDGGFLWPGSPELTVRLEGDKIFKHVPQLLEQVMADLDAHTDEKWFNKGKMALLALHRKSDSADDAFWKTERFFQQMKSRRPFSAMSTAEAGLRALTFDRFKELIRSYNDLAWVIDEFVPPTSDDFVGLKPRVVSNHLAPIKQLKP